MIESERWSAPSLLLVYFCCQLSFSLTRKVKPLHMKVNEVVHRSAPKGQRRPSESDVAWKDYIDLYHDNTHQAKVKSLSLGSGSVWDPFFKRFHST